MSTIILKKKLNLFNGLTFIKKRILFNGLYPLEKAYTFQWLNFFW